jgi:maleate cis-trans isomerase
MIYNMMRFHDSERMNAHTARVNTSKQMKEERMAMEQRSSMPLSHWQQSVQCSVTLAGWLLSPITIAHL